VDVAGQHDHVVHGRVIRVERDDLAFGHPGWDVAVLTGPVFVPVVAPIDRLKKSRRVGPTGADLTLRGQPRDESFEVVVGQAENT